MVRAIVWRHTLMEKKVFLLSHTRCYPSRLASLSIRRSSSRHSSILLVYVPLVCVPFVGIPLVGVPLVSLSFICLSLVSLTFVTPSFPIPLGDRDRLETACRCSSWQRRNKADFKWSNRVNKPAAMAKWVPESCALVGCLVDSTLSMLLSGAAGTMVLTTTLAPLSQTAYYWWAGKQSTQSFWASE